MKVVRWCKQGADTENGVRWAEPRVRAREARGAAEGKASTAGRTRRHQAKTRLGRADPPLAARRCQRARVLGQDQQTHSKTGGRDQQHEAAAESCRQEQPGAPGDAQARERDWNSGMRERIASTGRGGRGRSHVRSASLRRAPSMATPCRRTARRERRAPLSSRRRSFLGRRGRRRTCEARPARSRRWGRSHRWPSPCRPRRRP